MKFDSYITSGTKTAFTVDVNQKLIKYNKFSLKKAAFTLAETLITLTIIGVIAVLLTPILLNQYFEAEAVSKVKQTYSTIATAFKNIETEYGCKGVECFQDFNIDNSDTKKQFEPIEKKLDIVAVACPKTLTEAQNISWLSPHGKTKNIDGEYSAAYEIEIAQNNGNNICYYLLANGVCFSVASERNWNNKDFRKYIAFDINGAAPPNQLGKDKFSMGIFDTTGTTPHLVLHPWHTPGHAGGLCAKYRTNYTNCFGKTKQPERFPLEYVLLHNKLPNFKKLK